MTDGAKQGKQGGTDCVIETVSGSSSGQPGLGRMAVGEDQDAGEWGQRRVSFSTMAGAEAEAALPCFCSVIPEDEVLAHS